VGWLRGVDVAFGCGWEVAARRWQSVWMNVYSVVVIGG
jgi:hypothetical protein